MSSPIVRRRPRVLVFCVALNRYDTIYARNIESHRRYAERMGYAYTLVREPVWATVREAVWLKIALLDSALRNEWDWVMFVDADCEITGVAPPVASLAQPGKEIYLAPGFSGNVNSGVIIARNGSNARDFFGKVLAAAGTSVPEEDWGENGHIIHFAKTCPAFAMIDRAWNNNADPAMVDYVRHYSAGGPMRPLYAFDRKAEMTKLLVRVVNKAKKLVGRHDVARAALVARLHELADRVGRRHPEFA